MKRYIRSSIASYSLVKNSKDPKVLAQLANDDDPYVRAYVAENSNTPADVLVQLANDEKWVVRKTVAANRNTPVDILEQLANDDDPDVRIHIAGNPNTPVDILEQLANDESMNARKTVAGNPNTPVDILVQLANDMDASVRWFVAKNSNTPADILTQLANDKDKDVREVAANNPNCPVISNKSRKSKNLNNWPSADDWYDIESDEEFENMWSRYLAGPEDEVNKELQIFTEPSIQGGMGGMFIFDESGHGYKSFSIDFRDWCDRERDMAAESNNADEYKQKYKDFVEAELIDEDWI